MAFGLYPDWLRIRSELGLGIVNGFSHRCLDFTEKFDRRW